jgi:hypothetical protein
MDRRTLALMLCAVIGAGMSSHSQDALPVSRAVDDFPAKVENLTVLPADISKSRLKRIMRGYETDLGVSCGYCHVEDHDSGIIDYASDENPRKHSARVMMSMVEAINEQYLAKLGSDRRYAVPVTCGSCHQGRSNPLAYEAH